METKQYFLVLCTVLYLLTTASTEREPTEPKDTSPLLLTTFNHSSTSFYTIDRNTSFVSVSPIYAIHGLVPWESHPVVAGTGRPATFVACLQVAANRSNANVIVVNASQQHYVKVLEIAPARCEAVTVDEQAQQAYVLYSRGSSFYLAGNLAQNIALHM